MTVLVVGCGLIGTSVGLALRDGDLGQVLLADRDELSLAEAITRGAGQRWDGSERVDIAVVAVPPRATAAALVELQGLDIAKTYTHVASVQTHVQAEIEALSSATSQIVGGHPLAGREVTGPGAALADLFVGRPWAVCPGDLSGRDAVEAVGRLAVGCGAIPVELSPTRHDRAVAMLSHLPQVAASALAGLLLAAHDETADELTLSGPGLLDTTRLAASDANLWTEILALNARELAPHVRELGGTLTALSEVLERLAQSGMAASGGSLHAQAAAPELEAVQRFLRQGNEGRAHVPVKRGELAGSFAGVRVEVADQPGRLAALLTCAGEAAVNVEDVRVEHLPGRPQGVIELLVAPGSEGPLRAALTAAGWTLA